MLFIISKKLPSKLALPICHLDIIFHLRLDNLCLNASSNTITIFSMVFFLFFLHLPSCASLCCISLDTDQMRFASSWCNPLTLSYLPGLYPPEMPHRCHTKLPPPSCSDLVSPVFTGNIGLLS